MSIWIEGSSRKPYANLAVSRGIVRAIAEVSGEVMQKSRFTTFQA